MMTIADMAGAGRFGDTMLAHVTPGDVVVPADVVASNPTIIQLLENEMGPEAASHMVGSGYERINPITGQPEFWFKKIFKKVLPIAATVAGYALGGPAGGAAGSALGTKLAGGSNTQALLAAGGSYLGGRYLGSGSGDVAGNLSQYGVTRSIADSLAGTSLGGISYPALTGSLTGMGIGGAVGGAAIAPEVASGSTAIPSFENINISRPGEMSLPGGMESLGGLSDRQKATNLATRGVEGGGLSPTERDFYINLQQRRLQDDQGNLADISELTPIEQTYFKQGLGLQFQPNTRSILESLARRNQSIGA